MHVQASADAVAKTMLDTLLGRLRGPVQLPECLRVVGYLRRLAVYREQVCAAFCLFRLFTS